MFQTTNQHLIPIIIHHPSSSSIIIIHHHPMTAMTPMTPIIIPSSHDLHPSLSFLHLGDAPGGVAELQGLEALDLPAREALHQEIQQLLVLDLA